MTNPCRFFKVPCWKIVRPFCKVDEASVGAGWNACRKGHRKQALTKDSAFKSAKKVIADSAMILFAFLKAAESSLASLSVRGLAKYLVPECVARFPVCGGRGGVR